MAVEECCVLGVLGVLVCKLSVGGRAFQGADGFGGQLPLSQAGHIRATLSGEGAARKVNLN
jgi:hypothetical protein